MKNKKKWLICRIAITFFSLCLLFGVKMVSYASGEDQKTVRVGYFAFDGYHDMDEDGNKSGYGYEVLQLMRRYENWKYEYVGYDKDWADMLEMLENGEIDMVTSAGRTTERLQKFDYSDVNIGTNSVVLTVKKDDDRYITGNYEDYNGMRVGLLRGNEKNEFMSRNAEKKGFTYKPVYYSSTEELEEALQIGEDVDAIVTSNLRKLKNEKVLEEFEPSEYYVIVKKGNEELLSEINHALVLLNKDEPGWRNRLKEKYYDLKYTTDVDFGKNELELLEELSANDKLLTVLVNPDNAPYSYMRDGKLCGIIPDLFQKIEAVTRISYQYLPVTTVDEYREAFESRKADIILDSTLSLQEVENMEMTEVGSRLTTSLSALYKRNMDGKIDTLAITKELISNAKDHYGDTVRLIEYPSFEECIQKVLSGECDATLLPSKRAEAVGMQDFRNQFVRELLPDQTINYSIIVSVTPYDRVPALLANAFNTITLEETEAVTTLHMGRMNKQITFIEFFYMHPVFFVIILSAIGLNALVILILTLKRKKQVMEQNKNLQEHNEFLRDRDPLTGGYNRNGFLAELEKLRSENLNLTEYDVLYINIRRFKVINDMIGSENGDMIFRHLFQNIVDSPLQPKLCARLEADHFAFLIEKKLLDLSLLEQALHINKELNGKSLKIVCTCGIYPIDNIELDVSRMLNYAQIAVRYITDESTELFMFYENKMRENYIDQEEVLSNYENAIENKEFKVFYQPIVYTATGKIASAEALVRWKKPDGSMIRPDLFIPVLEKNGCISKLDAFVENNVYQFQYDRQSADKAWVPVSVNLSWMDFHDKTFTKELDAKVKMINSIKNAIRYEITETAYAALESNKRALLDHLSSKGVDIVLDDFGSGYSSFGMIQEYKFEVLKLDMSFIRQIADNEKVRIIVSSIIDMCHRLEIRVVAEGVETENEVELLRGMNCDYIQGYYFSKPLCEEDFVKFLDT